MYKIELTKRARKIYLKLPEQVRQVIYKKLLQLAETPFASQHDVKQLQGIKNAYRLRVGDWRVVYQLHNKILIIEVIKIGHRKKVYR